MAIALAQTCSGHGNGVTAVTTSNINTASSGSKFLVSIHFSNVVDGASVSSVTDNKGNTYSVVDTISDNTQNSVRLYYCENGTGGSGHNFTANLTATTYPCIFGLEITGAATTSLDVHGIVDNFSSPFTITTSTFTQANNLVVCSVSPNNGGNPAGYFESTGFTVAASETDANTYWGGAVGYKIVSATTALTPSWTTDYGSTAGQVAYATIKQATGDPTAPSLISGPTASSISSAGFDIKGTPDEAGTAYLIVTAVGASQPSDGTFDASTETASMTASAEFTIHHTGQ